MGLMDKLKSAAKSVTGDWADLTLEAGDGQRGGTISLSTTVTVKSSEISVESVILEVRCEEIIDAEDAFCEERGSGTRSFTGRATKTETAFDKQVQVSGPVTLAAGSSTSYAGEISIPASAPAELVGRNVRYEWAARARLAMKGNDPDSGWQRINIS